MLGKIRDLYYSTSGFSFKSEDFLDAGTPLIRIGDFKDNEVKFSSSTVYLPSTYLQKHAKHTVKKGDILIALSGASLGKFATYNHNEEALVNQRVLVIRETKDKKSLTEYLNYLLYILQPAIVVKAVGGGQPNISPDKVLSFDIKHSLLEQSKIVAELNRIQEKITKRKEMLLLLDQFIESTFIERFLENPKYGNKFYSKIEDAQIIKSTTYGTAKKSNDDLLGVPVLKMNNLNSLGEIVLDDLKRVDLDDDEKERLKIENRSILFNRTNSPDLVGKVAVWDKGNGYTFAGYLIKIILDEKKMSPYYFTAFFNSHYGKKILQSKARVSGNLANISATTLKTSKILIPPIEDQLQFENIYLKVKMLKRQLQDSLELLMNIFQSTVYKKFIKNEKIDEEKIFEDILKDLSISELKQGNRLQYLLDWFDKNNSRFSELDKYREGYNKLIELLEDETLEQFYERKKIKLRVRK